MRKRNCKTVDGVTYEKVDTSRFFQVKARSVRSALKKLEFIHTLEVKDMFRSLTVESLLADKREARFLSTREAVEQTVSYPVKTAVATDYRETGELGFKYPKFTPCNFIERIQLITETIPTVGWID